MLGHIIITVSGILQCPDRTLGYNAKLLARCLGNRVPLKNNRKVYVNFVTVEDRVPITENQRAESTVREYYQRKL